MAQYTAGSVDISNGSNIVTGNGTTFLTEVAAGQEFVIVGEYVTMIILSVDSDTQLTLTTNWTRDSKVGAAYSITRDFSTNQGYPYWTNSGALNTNAIFARALIKIDQDIANILAGTGSGITGPLHLSDGSGTVPAYSFEDEQTLGLYRSGAGEITATGNVVVQGDLTVEGTTTQIDSVNLITNDNIVTLNADAPSTPTEDVGFTVYRGGTDPDRFFGWRETGDYFEFDYNARITGDFVLTGDMYAQNATSNTTISGGSGPNLGGNIVAYGEAHATLANDMLLRAGSTAWLSWDNSAGTATFAGDVVLNRLTLGAQTTQITTVSAANQIDINFPDQVGLDRDVRLFRSTDLGGGIGSLQIFTADNTNTVAVDLTSEGNATFAGALTASNGGSLTGTWSDLGSVTTIDINGGTIDGTVVGGAVAAAGSFTSLSASTRLTIRSTSTWFDISRDGTTSGNFGVFRKVDGATALGYLGGGGGAALSSGSTVDDFVLRAEGSLYLASGGNTAALALDSSQNATFAGDVIIDSKNMKLESSSDGSNGLARFYDQLEAEGGQIYAHSGELRVYAATALAVTSPSIRFSGNVNINGGNSVLSPDYANLAIGDFSGGNNGITLQASDSSRVGIAFSDANTTGVASRQGRFDFSHAGDVFEWLISDSKRMSLDSSSLYLLGTLSLENNKAINWRDNGGTLRTGINWNASDGVDIYTGTDNALAAAFKSNKDLWLYGDLLGSSGGGSLQIGASPNGVNYGGNILMYAEGHATNANDILLRAGSVAKLQWDDSASYWNFQDTNVVGLGDVVMSGNDFYRSVSNNSLTFSGGSSPVLGGNILLFGEAHASQANDILIRSGSTVLMQWDDSAAEWNFNGYSAFGIPVLHQSGTASTTQIAGGSGGASGGNIVVYGPAHATDANDILFRTGTTDVLRWDASASAWDFGTNILTGVSDIGRGTSTGSMYVHGGSTLNQGGNLVLFAESHASQAGDIELRTGTSIRAHWDDSANRWDWRQNNLYDVGDISMYGNDIHRNAATDLLRLSGGSAFNLGGNILLYGESHAIQSDDIEFRTAATVRLSWDASGDHWDFKTEDVIGIRTLEMSGDAISRNTGSSHLFVSGGSNGSNGGVILLYGESDATRPNDVVFRSGTSEVLTWDDSADQWDFQAKDIVTTGAVKVDSTPVPRIQWFDNNDDATSTTPIAHTGHATTTTKLTNDGAGPNSNSYDPGSKGDPWDTVNDEFDFSGYSVNDLADIRIDLNVTTSAASQEFAILAKFAVGGSFPFTLVVHRESFKTAGDYQLSFTLPFYIGSTDVLNNPMELHFLSASDADIQVNGWFNKMTIVT